MSIGEYIGKPYIRDCYDGTGFDCWSLIRWIYQKEGISLPKRLHEVWSPRKLNDNIKEVAQDWIEVNFKERKWLDVLLFTTSKNMNTHVGLVIDDIWYTHARPEVGVVLNKFSSGHFSALIKKVYRYNAIH